MLTATLQTALEGRGSVVTIGGDAGVGKSTLVRALAGEARQAGALVLTGHCYDLEVTPPYGPWIEIVQYHLAAGYQPAPPDALVDPVALESLSSAGELQAVAARFVLAVAAEQPLVIVLEDQHWADRASLEFLRVLTRQIAAAPVLIIMTYRDAELMRSQPLYQLLPMLIRESRATRIALRPLDRNAVRELIELRYTLADADLELLLDYTWRFGGGNPFFTEELLNALEYDGLLLQTTDGWSLGDLGRIQVPPLVAQFIENQLSRLDHRSLELLQIGAVIGPEVQFDLWQAVSGASDDELIAVIEQALDYRVFDEQTAASAYRFRHALIRVALYDQLVLPHRRRWHLRIGDTLAQHGDAAPDVVANHFKQAGDVRAIEWLYQAGIQAEQRYAWRSATERLDEAEQLLASRLDDRPTRAWLLYHISEVYRRFDVPTAQLRLDRANELAIELGDQLLIGHCLADRGLYRCFLGELRAGLVDLEAGIALLDEGVQQEPATSAVAFGGPSTAPDPVYRRGILINWLAAAGRYPEAIGTGEPFVAERQPPPPVASSAGRYEDYYDAYVGLGQAYVALGQPAKARTVLDRARDGYRVIERLPWLYFRAEIDYHVAYSIDQPAARIDIQNLLIAGYQSVTPRPEAASGLRHELLLFVHGAWAEIEDQAPGTLKRMPAGVTRLTITAVLGLIARHRGDSATVNRLLSSALPDGPATAPGDDWFPIATSLLGLAAASALESGDLETATAWIDTIEHWLDWGGVVIGRGQLELLRAGHALAQRDMSQALIHTEAALKFASEPPQPLALQAAHLSMARLLIVAGNLDQAASHLDLATQLAIACDTPFEHALALLTRAELEIAAGNEDAVPDLLESSRDILEPLRAAPALEHLAVLEQRLARQPARAPAGLSPRELEVLRLVVDGRTDREIAEELYISPRTVMNHVSSILNKFGVNSRAAAAAEAVRRGIV